MTSSRLYGKANLTNHKQAQLMEVPFVAAEMHTNNKKECASFLAIPRKALWFDQVTFRRMFVRSILICLMYTCNTLHAQGMSIFSRKKFMSFFPSPIAKLVLLPLRILIFILLLFFFFLSFFYFLDDHFWLTFTFFLIDCSDAFDHKD